MERSNEGARVGERERGGVAKEGGRGKKREGGIEGDGRNGERE